jgi:hypothetical protein
VATARITSEGPYQATNVPVGHVVITVVTPPRGEGDRLGKDKSFLKSVKIDTPFVAIPRKYANPNTSGLAMEDQRGSQKKVIPLD